MNSTFANDDADDDDNCLLNDFISSSFINDDTFTQVAQIKLNFIKDADDQDLDNVFVVLYKSMAEKMLYITFSHTGTIYSLELDENKSFSSVLDYIFLLADITDFAMNAIEFQLTLLLVNGMNIVDLFFNENELEKEFLQKPMTTNLLAQGEIDYVY